MANIEEALKSSKADPSTVSLQDLVSLGHQLDITPTCLPIIANIEEALKLPKADTSTVSSARCCIIGTLNKPIRHNRLPIIANIVEALKSSKADPSTVSYARSRIIGSLNLPIRHNPNMSPDYCQHRRSTEIIKS